MCLIEYWKKKYQNKTAFRPVSELHYVTDISDTHCVHTQRSIVKMNVIFSNAHIYCIYTCMYEQCSSVIIFHGKSKTNMGVLGQIPTIVSTYAASVIIVYPLTL